MSHRLTLTIHLLDDNTIRSLMESGGDPISFDQIGAMAASGHNAIRVIGNMDSAGAGALGWGFVGAALGRVVTIL